MSIVYPEIIWENVGEGRGDDWRWKGSAKVDDFEFEFDLRYQWGGAWKGHWTVIVNHGAIQTGHGPHGYLFNSSEESKVAAETEMKRRIDNRVADAIETLAAFTTMQGGL